MRDERTNNEQQLKIELLSQWKLEAESRNIATWWPKLEPMLIALHVGQIFNQCKWHSILLVR